MIISTHAQLNQIFNFVIVHVCSLFLCVMCACVRVRINTFLIHENAMCLYIANKHNLHIHFLFPNLKILCCSVFYSFSNETEHWILNQCFFFFLFILVLRLQTIQQTIHSHRDNMDAMANVYHYDQIVYNNFAQRNLVICIGTHLN